MLTSVSDTYTGKNIFITGDTGFLGKVLVEKLLYSCSHINKIYIFMRERKTVSPKDRFDEFLSHMIFDRVRKRKPQALQKLHLIEGDCLSHELGLSKNDKIVLESTVNIIFHIVATVKFNEKLETAIDLNVNGTIRVLRLAKTMLKLEHFVYVSTAYVNPWKREVSELVETFSLLKDFTPQMESEEGFHLKEKQLKDLYSVIGENKRYPNTYTLTKHMAEQVVLDFSFKLSGVHTIIVRPSIITAAAYEPIIGWIDSFNGPSAMMVETARGTIKSVIGNGNKIADMIPVDIVTNTLITCVWYQSNGGKGNFCVYNCTSGKSNPITWGKFGALVVKYSIKYPTDHILMYPGISFRNRNLIHRIIRALFHLFPAYVLDLILEARGSRSRMMRITKIIDAGIEANAYFTTHEWSFETASYDSLAALVKACPSRYDFNCDAKCYDWSTYLRSHMLGIREHLLKDPLETLPAAKTKLNVIFLVRSCLQLIFIYFLWSISHNYIFK